MNTAETRTFIAPHDRPCASAGLTSYRYPASHRIAASGWVMIGASSHNEALREAARSVSHKPELSALQVWDGSAYVPCVSAPVVAPVAEPEFTAIEDLPAEARAYCEAAIARDAAMAPAEPSPSVESVQPASRIPAVVDGDANQWGRDLFTAGLSFHFDDPTAEILGPDGKPLFTAAECAELDAILDGFTGEQYDAAMTGVMDALHEENRALRSRGVQDDAGKDDMHGKRGKAPAVVASPVGIRGTLESLGFTVRDSGGGVQFLGREAGKGLLIAATYGDGFSLPVDGEDVVISVLREDNLLELGSFTVACAELVSKLSNI